MSDDPSSTLALPLPRWPFLWPFLAIPAHVLNPILGLARNWNGSPGYRVLGVAMLLAGVVLGIALSLGSLAIRHRRELSVDSAGILLRPVVRVPRWLHDPRLFRTYRDHRLEIPRAQASLEWVGKSLLHGDPDQEDVHLGRGSRAERIAHWLVAQGFPEPVGR
jgi:hypothetical protein